MQVKTSGGVASGAFLLSFFVGLIGGAGFPMILVRAFVFALFAFALSEAIHLVAKRFLIASPGVADKEARPAGSHVDISVEEDSDTEPSETAAIMDHAPDGKAHAKTTGASSKANDAPVGGVLLDEGLLLGALPVSDALDLGAKGIPDETDGGAAGGDAGGDGGGADFAPPPPDSPPPASGAMDTLFPNTAMPLKDVKLPDIEHMTDAFVEKKEEELFEPPPRRHVANAAEALGKNYDPTKVANAIKTLLRK